MEFKPIENYDSHKKYKRIGSCTNCGDCCGGCPFLVWILVHDAKKGDYLINPNDIESRCSIHENPEDKDFIECYLERGCREFPQHPLSTPSTCGYSWVEDDGK